HLRIAEDGSDDVVEVVRNSTRERPDDLHAARPFQPHRESRAVTLEKLTLDGIGDGIAGKPKYVQGKRLVPGPPHRIEPHDALHAALANERHAGPAAYARAGENIL